MHTGPQIKQVSCPGSCGIGITCYFLNRPFQRLNAGSKRLSVNKLSFVQISSAQFGRNISNGGVAVTSQQQLSFFSI